MSDYTVSADGCWELVIVSHSMSLLNTDLDLPIIDTNCQGCWRKAPHYISLSPSLSFKYWAWYNWRGETIVRVPSSQEDYPLTSDVLNTATTPVITLTEIQGSVCEEEGGDQYCDSEDRTYGVVVGHYPDTINMVSHNTAQISHAGLNTVIVLSVTEINLNVVIRC